MKKKIFAIYIVLSLCILSVFSVVNAAGYYEESDYEVNTELYEGLHTLLSNVEQEVDCYITVDGEKMLIEDWYANGGESIDVFVDPRVSFEKYVSGNVEIFNVKNGQKYSIPRENVTISFIDQYNNKLSTTEITEISGDVYSFEVYTEFYRYLPYYILVEIKDGDNIISQRASYDFIVPEDAEDDTIRIGKVGSARNILLEIVNRTTTIYFPEGTIINGDLNRDAYVNSTDAAIILDLFKNGNTTFDDFKLGDMDNNGILNATDAAMILDIFKNN